AVAAGRGRRGVRSWRTPGTEIGCGIPSCWVFEQTSRWRKGETAEHCESISRADQGLVEDVGAVQERREVELVHGRVSGDRHRCGVDPAYAHRLGESRGLVEGRVWPAEDPVAE